ncbi:hypothetical protein ACFFP0_23470 [Rhizobium puerariae]|uniref:Uncharacterized protein n=1 Tax=Rhizobium puerariae TaxID=1585791 RepID=A0ABV6AR96_9HYPH
MLYKFIVLFAAIMMSAVLARAQTGGISNNGNCNINITGTGNNISVSNPCGDSSSSSDFLTVFTGNAMYPIFGLNNYNVNWTMSELSLTVDNKSIIDQDLGSVLNPKSRRLKKGSHYYEIKISVLFFNGVQSDATCGGILNLQADAVLMPRISVVASPVGQLFSQGCGFELRP